MTTDERYTNLMLINLGEALTEAGNLCQRGAKPGPDFATVRLSLRRAVFASQGLMYEAPNPEIDTGVQTSLTVTSNECDKAPTLEHTADGHSGIGTRGEQRSGEAEGVH